MKRLLIVLLSGLLLLSVTSGVLAAPGAQDTVDATPTATPAADSRPDSCERNDTRKAACALTLDQVNGPFTFLPEGDQDWYRLDLGKPDGRTTQVIVRSAGDLTLRVSISRDDGTQLAAFSTPEISATLDASIGNPVVIRVENQSPSSSVGSSYNIELRKTLPPPPAAPPAGATAPTLPPDALENNYDVDHATPIAIGVIYDLNFTCPVTWPGACGGGDHDYLTVPVKQGVPYVIATFDLGPGVDTVLDLFWGRTDAPQTSTDDYGKGMLSVLHWVAPANGTAIVRIGPRNGGMQAVVDDDKRGFYRFAVAPLGTPLEQQLRTRLNEQGVLPSPTPTAAPLSGSAGSAGSTGSAGGAGPAAPVLTSTPAATPSSDAPTGEAVVTAAQTTLRERPGADAAAIQTLDQEAIVSLTGQVSGAWVRVQPRDSVVPGWLYGPDLRPLHGGTSAPATEAPPDQALPTATAISPNDGSGTLITATPALETGSSPPAGSTTTDSVLVPVTRVGILPTPTVAADELVARVINVDACVVASTSQEQCRTPIAGLQVDLVQAATREVLSTGRTAADGRVRLPVSVPQQTGLILHVPVLGLLIPLKTTDTTVPLRLPASQGATP